MPRGSLVLAMRCLPWFALAILSTPAYAQVDLAAADKLANGTVGYALAVACIVEAAVVVFLFREMRTEQKGRIEDLIRGQAQILETHSNVVKLGLQTTEAVEVLGKAVEHVTRRDP